MKTVNFNEIIVLDIEGNEQHVSVWRDLGNAMYMRGKDIEECELGKKIYLAGKNGESVNISDDEAEIVKKYIGGYGYVVRQAIVDTIS